MHMRFDEIVYLDGARGNTNTGLTKHALAGSATSDRQRYGGARVWMQGSDTGTETQRFEASRFRFAFRLHGRVVYERNSTGLVAGRRDSYICTSGSCSPPTTMR